MPSLRSIRRRFFTNSITEEDLKEVTILNDVTVTLKEEKPQYGGIRSVVDGFGELYHNGMAKSFLCNKSKKFMREQKLETCQCDLLVLKRSGELWKEYLEGGFYKFNSSRQIPDSVVSFKPTI